MENKPKARIAVLFEVTPKQEGREAYLNFGTIYKEKKGVNQWKD